MTQLQPVFLTDCYKLQNVSITHYKTKVTKCLGQILPCSIIAKNKLPHLTTEEGDLVWG